MSLISVIVPVYKVEKYINRCVDSILGQTFTDFELILVDDGSPDRCGVICDEYANKDSRVIIIHQSNGGLSAARNAGIDWAFANSYSEWLSFIDSDDWVHPRYLEALYNVVVNSRLDVAVCGFERSEGDNPIVDEEMLEATVWNTGKFYVEKNVDFTVAWGKIYRKESFADIRYPVGKLYEDEFTTYRILFKYDEICYIEQPLYAYYKNQTGIMQSKWGLKKLEAFNAYDEQARFFEENGYDSALRKCRNNYMCSLVGLLLNSDNNVDDKYKPLLRKMLRNFLHVNNIELKGNEYPYEAAYPRLMYLYWTYKGVLGRLKS